MAISTKADLRKEFLAKRNALDTGERARASSLIRQRVMGHEAWKNASVILCYVSFGSEIDTHPLIQEALRFKKKIVVPLHDPAKTHTLISELGRFSELGANHRGVLQQQPEFQRPANPAKVDLALIPGIVFDKSGARIGFGGGYFDRLLPTLTQAFFIGLAFESQLSPLPLPLEAHDVRMQAIVTEKGILKVQ